ncbi:MAG: winged helix-turn-helix transcriptional regulator [Balneolaceae bacterium]
MRPTSKPDSYLRNPLDQILGYPANIQLLRILVETGWGMSASEISKRTGLSVPGVHKVISRLLKTGVIQQEGSGRSQLIIVRKEHPLIPVLTELFQTEKNKYENLLEKLKKIIDELKVKPSSVWLYGKVAKRIDDYGDSLQIAIYDQVKRINELTDNYKKQLIKENIERDFDVTIEVRGVTSADKYLIIEPDKMMIWGVDPIHLLEEEGTGNQRVNSHQDLDKRSLSDADLWIDFLKTHPEAIERTKSYLKGKIQAEKSGVRNELKEWYRLLESMSFQRLKKFLQSDSEHSTRLRQSLPFWPVLTEADRKEFKSMVK